MYKLIDFFRHENLPAPLAAVCTPIRDLAELMETTLPDSAEKKAGLRKLLEARDCFARAAVGMTPNAEAPAAGPTPAVVVD